MSFSYDVCVVGGGGHVGLPLAITFATRGLSVWIVDRNEAVLGTIASGKMPFLEVGGDAPLQSVMGKNLWVSSDSEVVGGARWVVVAAGTPVDEHLNPKLNQILDLFAELAPKLRNGQCIVLRSTVFPGTTEKVRDLLARAGLDVHVTFCPERVAEGRAMEELTTLPQLVAGCDPIGTRLATELFEKIAPYTIPLGPTEAELAKIFTNAWRYIQFATANQFLMIAANYGLDFHRIQSALTREYPRMAGLPSSGFAAGPCLFKDTMQLAAADHHHFWLGHAAMLVNEGLPSFIVRHAKQRYSLATMTVGILGMAFKANSDDPRESLSYKLRKALVYEAKEVLCTDVYIQDPSFASLEVVMQQADLLIVGAPHREYKDVEIAADRPLIDVWNFYRRGVGL
ncbi:MAG: nucleotide sugar dehydrogenase [Deltaproteobacteria bacterium]|nr:nucleotide sugar dehydrogenase [Deltaproteobacteria bacterium]